MPIQASPGEDLVGAYHRLINECELVSYNQRSMEQGNQMELDVSAINSESGDQTVYACEAITHVGGMLYVGEPSTDRWTDYGNDNYQHTLDRIWSKFQNDSQYVTEVFNTADFYRFQLWSPVVPEGYLTNGLEELGPKLEADLESTINSEVSVDLIYNGRYTEKINQLRELAGDDAKDYGNTAFRHLQILEHLR